MGVRHSPVQKVEEIREILREKGPLFTGEIQYDVPFPVHGISVRTAARDRGIEVVTLSRNRILWYLPRQRMAAYRRAMKFMQEAGSAFGLKSVPPGMHRCYLCGISCYGRACAECRGREATGDS